MVLYLIFGSRKSELLSAQWKDFNLAKQEWVVRPTKLGEEIIISMQCMQEIELEVIWLSRTFRFAEVMV